jgi:flagellar capping protein FliD
LVNLENFFKKEKKNLEDDIEEQKKKIKSWKNREENESEEECEN